MLNQLRETLLPLRNSALLLLALVLLLSSFRLDDRPAYRLFTAAGQPADYDAMLADLAGADVVLFGEIHNVSLAHWLELQVAADLARRKGPGQVGAGPACYKSPGPARYQSTSGGGGCGQNGGCR